MRATEGEAAQEGREGRGCRRHRSRRRGEAGRRRRSGGGRGQRRRRWRYEDGSLNSVGHRRVCARTRGCVSSGQLPQGRRRRSVVPAGGRRHRSGLQALRQEGSTGGGVLRRRARLPILPRRG